MSAHRHEFGLGQAIELPPLAAWPSGPHAEGHDLDARWRALHEAAGAVAAFAQLAQEEPDPERDSAIGRAVDSPVHHALALRGIEDLCAVMETGLRALIGSAERGRDATPAAIALWSEFHAGREAICRLAGSGRAPG